MSRSTNVISTCSIRETACELLRRTGYLSRRPRLFVVYLGPRSGVPTLCLVGLNVLWFIQGALCAEVIRPRVSSNQNDETLSRNLLRYLSKSEFTQCGSLVAAGHL